MMSATRHIHAFYHIAGFSVNPERQPDRKECFDINPLVAEVRGTYSQKQQIAQWLLCEITPF